MLIIAVSFENNFTCSCKASSSEVNKNDVSSVLSFAHNFHKFGDDEAIDELLVVDNEDLITYTALDMDGVR